MKIKNLSELSLDKLQAYIVPPLWDSGQATGLSQTQHPITPRAKLVSNQWRKPGETPHAQNMQTPTHIPIFYKATLHYG